MLIACLASKARQLQRFLQAKQLGAKSASGSRHDSEPCKESRCQKSISKNVGRTLDSHGMTAVYSRYRQCSSALFLCSLLSTHNCASLVLSQSQSALEMSFGASTKISGFTGHLPSLSVDP